MAKGSSKPASGSNGAALAFEATFWASADKLGGNLDAAGYKHVVLGLLFLKYISDALAERRDALQPKLLTGEIRVKGAERVASGVT